MLAYTVSNHVRAGQTPVVLIPKNLTIGSHPSYRGAPWVVGDIISREWNGVVVDVRVVQRFPGDAWNVEVSYSAGTAIDTSGDRLKVHAAVAEETPAFGFTPFATSTAGAATQTTSPSGGADSKSSNTQR